MHAKQQYLRKLKAKTTRKNKLVDKPLIVYWNNIPTPYMVDRFNALAERGNLRFEAWFNDKRDPSRSWTIDESSWRFNYKYLPSAYVGKYKFHWPVPVIKKRPDVIVSLYAEPVFLFGWVIAKLRGCKTAFWCQVTHDKWVKRSWLKEKIKKIIFPKVDATLGSGEESRSFAMKYGISTNKALCLRHSIDVKHFSNGANKYKNTRKKIKEELGIRGITYIYVGRLWWGKGLRFLLEAFKQLQRVCDTEVSLLIVGDGSDEGELRKMCLDQNIKNVKFAGFQQKKDLPRFYAAADVFVFPTLGDPYGLVVDEAMACSLPIISTSAAGEIRERVKEDINGIIVTPENVKSLTEAMLRFIDKPHLLEYMGKNSKQLIIDHTPERWAIDFENIVFSLLEGRI